MISMSLRTAGLLCALIGAALYLNTLDCELAFDDEAAIKDNKDLRPNESWSNLLWDDFWGTAINDRDSHKSYRPLCVATFRLNYLLHELQPMGYHLVNVLLHGAVCYLYVQLCGVIFSEVWPALIAGLLFAVHPIHTEAVAGLVGRADILSCIFYILAVFTYQRAIFSYKWLPLTMCMILCSALSKELGITVVAVCLVYEFFVFRKMNMATTGQLLKGRIPGWFGQFLLRAVVLAAFTISFLVMRFKLNEGPPIFSVLNNPAMSFPSPSRQLHWAYLCFVNLWLLFNPWQLCAEYAMGTIAPIQTLSDPRNLLTLLTFAVIAFLGLYTLLGAQSRHKRTVLFGLGLLVLPFIPATNLFFPVGFVVAERVLYLPSMGFCLLIGYGVWCLLLWHKHLPKLCLFYLLVFHSAKLVTRNRDWYSSLDLFISAVTMYPSNAKMVGNVGSQLDLKGNRTTAIALFNHSTVVEPTYVTSYMNLGYVLREENRMMEAMEIYRTAANLVLKARTGDKTIHITPKNIKAYNSASNMLREHTDENDLSLKFANLAVQAEPDWENGYHTRANILLKMGRLAQAKVDFERAVKINPKMGIAYSNLGECLSKMGLISEAEMNYRKCLELEPKHTLTKFRLASAITKSGDHSMERLEEAERLLKDVLEEDPTNGNATFSLALVYNDMKDYSRAEEAYLEALKLAPNDAGVLYNLGVMYTTHERYNKALEYLTLLLEHHPQHTSGLSQLATNYMQLKNYTKASELFETVLKLKPNETMALQNYGLLKIFTKRYEESLQLFEKLYKIAPSEPVKSQIIKLKEKLASTSKTKSSQSSSTNSVGN